MPPKRKRLQAKDFAPQEMQTHRSLLKRTPFSDFKIIYNNKGKLACVVKKNMFGEAVLRNKLRRKVYSILYTIFRDTSYSVIAYPRKQALTTKASVLTTEMTAIKKELS